MESKNLGAVETASFLDSSENLKEGWLSILYKKKWERRYFILKRGSSMLNYFKSPKDRTKGKIIQLFLSSCAQSNVKGQKYTFQLISRAENFMLKAESIEEMNSWILLIQETCAGLLSAGLDTSNPLEINQLSESLEFMNSSKGTDEEEEDLSSSSGGAHAYGLVHSPRVADLINHFNHNDVSTQEDQSKGRAKALSMPASNAFKKSQNDTLISSPMNPRHATQHKRSGILTLVDLVKRFPTCCDCNNDLTEVNSYVSLLIGSFVCYDCATIHLSLLNQGSDIRSFIPNQSEEFPLFDTTADPMAMTYLGFMGNKKVNDYWEASIPERVVKPNGNSSLEEKKHWISEKYLKKTFKGCKQGILFIKTPDRKKFKRFWVVLGDSSLFIYNKKEDSREREVIQLQSCGVKIGDDPAEPECFSIITPGKRYKLQAVTFPAALEWANAVRVAAATLVQALAASNSRSKSLSKSCRRASRLLGPYMQSENRSNQSRDSEWYKSKSEIIHIEEQIQTHENEIIDMESRILRARESIKDLLDEKFDHTKELYEKVADWTSDFQVIRHNRNFSLLAANVEGFIHEIYSSPEEAYYLEFILSYRSFMSTSRLLNELAECYNNSSTSRDQRDNINRFIEGWLTDHFYDVDGDYDAIRHVVSFIENPIDIHGYHSFATRLRLIVRNHIIFGLSKEKMIEDNLPQSIEPKPSLNYSFLDFDSLEIARQLSILDQEIFFSIKPREFLNRGWLQEDRSTESPNVRKMLDQFDQRINWVLTSILTLDGKKRSAMLGKFIQVAKHCATLRNYNACMQIMNAIEDNIILRFDGTWEGVNQKTVPLLLELRKLLSKANNFSNLKEEIYSNTSTPCVPYLNAFLDEIVAIELDLPDYVNQLINFEKRRKISRVILEIQHHQVHHYHLRPVPVIQNYLIKLEGLSKNELLNYSILTKLRDSMTNDGLLSGLHPLPTNYLPTDLAPKPPASSPNESVDSAVV